MTRILYLSQGDVQLSDHIRLSMLQCDNGQDSITVSDKLIELTEKIIEIGQADHIVITSGNRNLYDTNRKIGYVGDGHFLGLAMDFMLYKNGVKIPHELVCCYAQKANANGIGVCNGATHIDVKSRKWWFDEVANCYVSDFFSYFGFIDTSEIQENSDLQDTEFEINEGKEEILNMTKESLLYEIQRKACDVLGREFGVEELNNYYEAVKVNGWKWFDDTLTNDVDSSDEHLKLWIKLNLYVNVLHTPVEEIPDSALKWWKNKYRATSMTKMEMLEGFAYDYQAYFNSYNN